MKKLTIALMALGLAACGQTQQQEAAAPAPAVNNCPATAETVWVSANGGEYKVQAETAGADCASAEATLTVRGPEGQQLHQFKAPAQNILGLREAADQPAMAAAVTAWLSQTPDNYETTAGLPDWRAASLQPEITSEFRFYPETGATRDQYLAVRAARLPMFCYAQGRESLACLVLEGGAVRRFGIQQVPG